MVEPAKADVVGPAIATDEPDRFFHQIVRIASQLLGCRILALLQQLPQLLDMGPLLGNRQGGIAEHLAQRCRYGVAQARQQTAHPLPVLIDGETEPQSELGVVFKQRVGPGRPAPVGVGGVGGGRQVAAINGRAAGGVGNQQPIAIELSQQLDIGVSPQPEQAPEYSNSGEMSWEVRMSMRSSCSALRSGRSRKKS